MTRPSSLNLMSSCKRRCVPITTSTLPSASSFSVWFCSLVERNRDSDAMRIGKSAKRSAKFLACCSTSSVVGASRSEEHTSELQSLMRISYAVFCLKKKTTDTTVIAAYRLYCRTGEQKEDTPEQR